MRDSRYVLVAKASPAQVRWLRALARVHRTPLPPRLREKGGRTVAKITTNTDAGAVQAEIHRHVEIGFDLAYRRSRSLLGHRRHFNDTVNHWEGEFICDGVTTNEIESVFAVLKRGLIGVYHHASPKHLDRYVNEFMFRI